MAYHDFNMDNHWLPFTPNRSFKKDPRVFVAADGMNFTTHDGRKVIDGISSLWCVGAGHNRRQINEAIKLQLDTLDYATAFQASNDKAFIAAEMIAAMAVNMAHASGETNGRAFEASSSFRSVPISKPPPIVFKKSHIFGSLSASSATASNLSIDIISEMPRALFRERTDAQS